MTRKSVAHQRREEIVEALYACLSRMAHDKATIKEIAKAAGLSYGSLHYYFKGKREIMMAVVDYYVEKTGRKIQKRLLHIEYSWEMLRVFISVAVDLIVMDHESSLFYLNVYQMAINDEGVRQRLVRGDRILSSAIAWIIEYGISKHEFAEVDSKKLGSFMSGWILGMWIQTIYEPNLFARETAENLLYEAFRNHLDPKRALTQTES